MISTEMIGKFLMVDNNLQLLYKLKDILYHQELDLQFNLSLMESHLFKIQVWWIQIFMDHK
jgi:hypothetical protein